MTAPARSVLVFGVYLVLLGLSLILIPDTLLGLFGMPLADDLWVRIAGMLTSLIAFYYIQAARHELRLFFGWTVVARAAVILFFVAFVLLDFASPILILFGVIDVLGAAWTGLALRKAA